MLFIGIEGRVERVNTQHLKLNTKSPRTPTTSVRKARTRFTYAAYFFYNYQ